MNNKQKELLRKLAGVYDELALECEKDSNFENVLINNNDLYPLSLDEMGAEWRAVAEGERKK